MKVLNERVKSRIDDRIGLLPALAPDEPWTQEVRDLSGALHRRVLADSSLANFATHMEPLPNTFGAFRMEEGRLVVPLPDTPDEKLFHWTELTFESERDVRAFAETVLSSVEEFVDRLIEVFVEANRDRDPPRSCKREVRGFGRVGDAATRRAARDDPDVHARLRARRLDRPRHQPVRRCP